MMLVIIFKKDHVMVLCPWYQTSYRYLFSVHSLRNEKTYHRWWSKCQTFCQQRMIKPPYIKWCVKSSFFSRFTTLLFRTGPSALLLIPSTFYYYCGLVFLPCLLKKGLISRHSKIVKCCNHWRWTGLNSMGASISTTSGQGRKRGTLIQGDQFDIAQF